MPFHPYTIQYQTLKNMERKIPLIITECTCWEEKPIEHTGNEPSGHLA